MLPTFVPSFQSTGLSVQEKKQKIDFQNDGHGGHLGFPIGTILAIFNLQVTLMLPTKFRELTFGFRRRSEKFSPNLENTKSWINDWHNFSYF